MGEGLRKRLSGMLSGWGCPDIATDAVLEVIAPVVVERDQLRALVEYADAIGAHQQRTIEELREENRRLREALDDQGPA